MPSAAIHPLRPGMPRPWVIAHRGSSAHAPENSLRAFALAAAAGVDACETDVRLSADGIPVLCHDPDLLRVAGRREQVATWKASALNALALQDRNGFVWPEEGIPRLDVALRLHPHMTFFLEMKADGMHDARAKRQLAETTARYALEAIAAGVTAPILLSFEQDLLDMAACVAPELCTARNLLSPCNTATDLVSCAIGSVTASFVAQQHHVGKAVLAFTVNHPEELQFALACKIDGLFCDDPTWLLQQLDQHLGKIQP
jgi:glycerophosphoryl diester phosphodiesterase